MSSQYHIGLRIESVMHLDYKYATIHTSYGHFAFIVDISKGKVSRTILPMSKDKLLLRIRTHAPSAKCDSTIFSQLSKKFSQFFNGEVVDFSMDMVDKTICSDFQLRVLESECTIPRGKTASYSWLARKVNSNAVRAVGSALARNPFAIIVPCHRTVKSDRSIGGFQGGTEMKRAFLEMEGVTFDKSGRVAKDCFIS